MCSRVATSATFKQAKGDLVKKGWDPVDTKGDKLYWLNGTKYEKLDVQSWSSIASGHIAERKSRSSPAQPNAEDQQGQCWR